MSNETFTNRKFVVAFPSKFNIQEAFDISVPTALIDGRQPQNTPAHHAIIPFREEIRDCTGEFIRIEKLTGKIARFTFAFDVTALFAAGWFAYTQGAATEPDGTPTNEKQVISRGGATGGEASFNLDFEGQTGAGSLVPTTAATTAAQIREALESCRAIKPGNVSVTGSAGGPWTVEFIGYLAAANIPLMTVADDNSTGGSGVTVVANTTGEAEIHEITRTTSSKPVKFSLIEAFIDDDGETVLAKKYKNLVVGTWSVSATRRGKLILTVVAFGSDYPDVLSDYEAPACSNDDPILAGECRLAIGGTYVTGDLNTFTYTEDNQIDVSEEALAFDDVDIDELVYGDRVATLTAQILGSPGAALYAFAHDENNAFDDFELDLGGPGNRLAIIAPNAQFKLDDGQIEFIGNKNRSAFTVNGRPSPDESTGVVTRGTFSTGTPTDWFLQTS